MLTSLHSTLSLSLSTILSLTNFGTALSRISQSKYTEYEKKKKQLKAEEEERDIEWRREDREIPPLEINDSVMMSCQYLAHNFIFLLFLSILFHDPL